MSEVDILLVEDSSSDAGLMIEALQESAIPHKLDHALTGEEALRLLRTREFNPDLVLLDLNLPLVSGFDALVAIKTDPKLKRIPVIILTNSFAHEDVVRCYEAHANAYVRKPLGWEELNLAISNTSRFWFKTASLPATFNDPPMSLGKRKSAKPATKKRRP